ncbi:RecQ family ATP-dependent DNA helicase [Pseudoflavitalea sp. G-6-1-2]|uniref:RecQ family ATP-dependent DNA helicase n=1 Tax=Pseudoflavitalea sp. G-6-1-2 TaxID=2728841 RepID=UPI00146DFEEA|nr:ATP-dependent DNA helicase RecQ [Pseudoflavitalea sp. G-6-1-2]NML20543.1 RecQ family ATP-dependent DNA helicase [Pseudoflavitalea sp. G-6-1-2]
MSSIHSLLKEYWKHDGFRPMQEAIIHSVLDREDTLAILPTGGGKSLCFQLPTLIMEGLCLVVSPLIALMKDQVENLRKKGITAYAIDSGMTRKQVINILKVATESNCKFLYVSPERLETTLFKEYLPGLDLCLIAVDEAHCISQWGYDFRPSYLKIAALRDEVGDVPILALTASATPEVQEDICEKLQFSGRNIFRTSFERPNLSYSVFEVDSKVNKIREILDKVPGSSIIYCRSRKRTKQLSDQLNMYGIQSACYHAGLTREERNRRQEAWIKNETRCIVCTNAFGMGIDKPDVRVVIHADPPDCMENYYQEAGRAGRDGKRSYAVLLSDHTDAEELRALPDIRFPGTDDIKKIYSDVMNYLQVPNGLGSGNYYDFELNDLIAKFHPEPRLATYALKAMEQEGWMNYNEQVFIPASVTFITGKEWLYDFQETYPQLEPIVQTLLRTYEGIFDVPVPISEKNIAYLMRSDAETVKLQLRQLHGYAIIEYIPQKDTPQLYLRHNRVRVEELRIDTAHYQKRKQLYESRIKTLLHYLAEKDQCRSQQIAQYFGDANATSCGVCDICLEKRKQPLTPEELALVHQQIRKQKTVTVETLMQSLTNLQKHKLQEAITFLQSEQKIKVNEKGEISDRN